jgi:hypothetical protein
MPCEPPTRPGQSAPERARAKRIGQWVAIVLLLALAAGQFWRTARPVNGTHGLFWDFSIVYSASRAMLQGHDPYQLDNVYAAWEQERHWEILAPTDRSKLKIWISVNPPSSLAMLAPLAVLGSSAAHTIWIASDVVLFVLVLLALWQLGNLRSAEDRLLLMGAMLASSPVFTAFRSGQLCFPACAGVILAAWAVANKREILAGILLGLAVALKFQLAGPFVLFYLLVRRWRVSAIATAVFAAISLAAIIPLEMHQVHWLAEWKTNSIASTRPGMENDQRPGSIGSESLINLQPALSVLMGTGPIATGATLLCCAALGTLFLWGIWRARGRGDYLLALSCVALLSFLPIYRRIYDAMLLAFLLTWAIAALRTDRRTWGIVTLVLLAGLLVPIDMGTIILQHMHALRHVASTRVWQSLVVQHSAWTVVILAAWAPAMYTYLAMQQRGRAAQILSIS